MNGAARTAIAAIFIVLALLGVGYGWKTATIIADTTPPDIIEESTTHGDVSYPPDGKLTVIAVVRETVGMKMVTCELFSGLPPTGTRLEKITLSLAEKLSGDLYKYRGTFTKTLTKEKTYYLRYWATDEAGHKTDWQTSVRLINLDGYVKVNGRKVTGPDDEILVTSLDLTIQVYVTAGADTVQGIYCLVNGERVRDFAKKGNLLTGFYWETTYTLPEDGRYSFLIQVLDTAGNEAQFASFTVSVGSTNKWLMIGGAVGVLGLVAAYGYLGRKERKRR